MTAATTSRRLVHFVGGPWDAMHSHYRGIDAAEPMICPGGAYAFARADRDGAFVYVFSARAGDL